MIKKSIKFKKLMNSLTIVFTVVNSFFILISCSKDSSKSASGNVGTNSIKIENALYNSNSNFVNLVNRTRGSVGTNSSGSKVVWRKKNDFSLGLFVSANHVYSITTWDSLNEEFLDIATINDGIFSSSKMPQ